MKKKLYTAPPDHPSIKTWQTAIGISKERSEEISAMVAYILENNDPDSPVSMNEKGEKGTFVSFDIIKMMNRLQPKNWQEIFFIGSEFARRRLEQGLKVKAIEEIEKRIKTPKDKFEELFGDRKKEDKKSVN